MSEPAAAAPEPYPETPIPVETAENGIQLHITVEPVPAILLLDGAPLPACTRAGQAFYGVTRALTFSGGALAEGAPDVEVFDWGGGIFEASLRLPPLPAARPRTFP